jgi:transcription antitermination factor NusG
MASDSPHFTVGDPVAVVQGPYSDFHGIVVHAPPAAGKVGIKLAFCGRKAQLTLDASMLAPLPRGR